ncbi:glycosyltransferase [Empedobacter falsenii]
MKKNNYKKKNIFLLTPGLNKPMGVFSINYVKEIEGVRRYFGGVVPIFSEGTSLLKQKIVRYLITLISLNSPKRKNIIYEFILYQILKKNKVNSVIAEYLHTGASVYKVCEKLNIPIVSIVLGYDISKENHVNNYYQKYKNFSTYKNAHIVCVSKNMIGKVKDIGFKNVYYSPIGAKSFFFNVIPNLQSKNIVAMGRFTEKKSPENTIRAFKILHEKYPAYKLIFVGDGELLGLCKDLVKELDIKDSVVFPGWVSQEKQCEIFKDCLMFVQHLVIAKDGDSEGTPVVIIEAMASGLPIVSTFHGGIPEVVIDGFNGYLVKEHDYTEMASKMICLVENQDRIIEFSENSRKLAFDSYSSKAHTSLVSEIIVKNIINE